MIRKIFIYVIIFALVMPVLSSCKEEYLWETSSYCHIQYDANDYYIAEDQSLPFDDFESNRVDIYLVDSSDTVYKEDSYSANIFKGDEELQYLYFDGAVYTKDKSIASSESHKCLINE